MIKTISTLLLLLGVLIAGPAQAEVPRYAAHAHVVGGGELSETSTLRVRLDNGRRKDLASCSVKAQRKRCWTYVDGENPFIHAHFGSVVGWVWVAADLPYDEDLFLR